MLLPPPGRRKGFRKLCLGGVHDLKDSRRWVLEVTQRLDGELQRGYGNDM
jgi:hypothetical protein